MGVMKRTNSWLAVLVLTSQSVNAHHFWVEPDHYQAQPGEQIGVLLRRGHRGATPDVFPLNSRRVSDFVLSSADARVKIDGIEGSDPAGKIRPAKPGLYAVGYYSTYDRLETAADKFEAELRLEGLESIIEQRQKRHEADKPAREIYARCAKTLLNVGSVTTGAAFSDRTVGLPLELVSGANPASVKPGEMLPLRLLYKGKPLAGIKVFANNKASDMPVSARTDAQGRVSLPLATPGQWLVTAVHMYPAAADADADWESLWATLTFELPKK